MQPFRTGSRESLAGRSRTDLGLSQHDLPQGATPYLAERGTPEIPKSSPERRKLWNSWVRNPDLCRDESFHEATGQVGDVYFLHPFMLHSASKNLLREARII